MSSPRLTLALSALLAAPLTACTGIVEQSPGARLAVLSAGGSALSYLDTGAINEGLQGTVTVEGGVDLATLSGGRALALTRKVGLEQRDVDLTNVQAFVPLTPTPCLTQTAQSAARDRLLTLSQCVVNGPQTLALYRADRTLVWTTTLSVTPPIPTTDTPPTRLAVRGDTAVVARAALGGGSEVVVVAPRPANDPVQDGSLLVGTPVQVPLTVGAVRDLAPSGDLIYAATDTGVRPLLSSGVPDSETVVAAFGNVRFDRLWAGVSGTRTLLAAWRDPALSGQGTEPLRLWDGTRMTPAPSVASFSTLRDVTLDLSGNLYTLSASALSRYDTVVGLNQNVWTATPLLGNLNDAQAVTWLVP